jgi:hydrogenase 3 maturation protease
LASWLSGAERVAVVGVGSRIRSDDAVGVVIVEGMMGGVPPDVALLICETSPESCTSSIRRGRPTHILIIDAAEIHSAPGSAELVDPKMTTGSTFSTHTLPLRILSEYIEQETGASIRLLAIQPKSIAFGTCLTDALSNAASAYSNILIDVLQMTFRGVTGNAQGKE